MMAAIAAMAAMANTIRGDTVRIVTVDRSGADIVVDSPRSPPTGTWDGKERRALKAGNATVWTDRKRD